jgi:hypothetical protein
MTVARAALLLALALSVGCGPVEPEVSLVEFPAPQALDSCASPPTLLAQLWSSSDPDPCTLDVAADGSASGSCLVVARAERTLTVDWYVNSTFGGEPVRVLMAQAKQVADLREPESDTYELTIGPDDIVVRGCVDVTGDDKVNGLTEIPFNGGMVAPCDLDASCGTDLTDEACSNLGEVCAGGDPLDPAL